MPVDLTKTRSIREIATKTAVQEYDRKEKHKAASKMQRQWKTYRLRLAAALEEKRKVRAVIYIQAHWRALRYSSSQQRQQYLATQQIRTLSKSSLALATLLVSEEYYRCALHCIFPADNLRRYSLGLRAL
jgi:hypothetical protein